MPSLKEGIVNRGIVIPKTIYDFLLDLTGSKLKVLFYGYISTVWYVSQAYEQYFWGAEK
jgi:hypothetical protein